MLLEAFLAQGEDRRPREGERGAVSGYPLNEPSLVTTSGHIASAWGIDIKEVSHPERPRD